MIGAALGYPWIPTIGPSLSSTVGGGEDFWWPHGPLITPDANTVAHVIWRNGALVDTKGNSWTMNGTVPQVAASGHIPPGAGSFSGANYYGLGAGADVLDFAGGTFSACVVGKVGGSLPVSSGGLLDNTAAGADGWLMHLASSGAMWGFAYAGPALVTANTILAGDYFFFCFGSAGNPGTAYAKLNGGITVSGASTWTVPTTRIATIGNCVSLSRPFNGTIYEVWASTSTPSDALFTSAINAAASRMRRSL